jgi:hypothetical protein
LARIYPRICFCPGADPYLTKDPRRLFARANKQRISAMAQTKFSAGQRVLAARGGGFGAPSGAFQVVKVLPLGAGPQQYRVRAEGGTFERVIEEGRLEAVRYD